MSKKQKNQQHLTLEGRLYIEAKLNEGERITMIANNLRKSKSSILREIMKHRYLILPNSYGGTNPCVKKTTCPKAKYACFESCSDLEINLCPKLISSPHVCNGCSTKHGCRYAKYYYSATRADTEYKNTLVNSRNHPRYSELEWNIINNDLSNLIRNTKSVYHSILVINNRGFNFKPQRIYELINKRLIDLKPEELPRNNRKRQKDKKTKRQNRKNL